jgi:predicted lipid-binding transport protein (Tim44 family)
MSTTTHSINLTATTHRAVYGIVGGLAGGVVFGLLMAIMDMIGMVAQLVGSSSAAVGWIVHLAISSFIGASFAVLLGSRAKTLVPAALVGMGYGVVWWVLGALLIMPAQLGMPVFEFNTTAWQSLMGHLLFGLVLGIVYVVLARRERD